MTDRRKTYHKWLHPGAWFAVSLVLLALRALTPSDALPPEATRPHATTPPAPVASAQQPSPTVEPVAVAEVLPAPEPLPPTHCYRPTLAQLDAPPPLGLGAVYGRVWKRSASGLEPAPGTRVEARSDYWNRSTQSDDAGWFRLELPPSAYRIQALLTGRGAAPAVMARVEFETQRVSLLVRPSGRLRGVVTFEGSVLKGAHVDLLAPGFKGAPPLGQVKTDAEGQFEFQGVPLGLNVVARVTAKTPEGHPTPPASSDEAQVTHAVPELDLLIDVKRGSSLGCQVVDAAGGAPLQGAKVVVSDAVSRGATTDAEGRFTVHGLPAGAYAVSLHQAGYFPGSASFEIDGETSLADEPIEMSAIPEGPIGRVRGIVRTRHYEPVGGADLRLVLTRYDEVTRVTLIQKAGPMGTFEFDDLPMGSGRLAISKKGFKPASKKFGLSKLKPDLDFELFLQREAAISGTVLLEGGAWGATVRVLGTGKSARTDEAGRFRFPELVPGTYRVEATAPGHAPERQTVELTELPPGPNLVIRLTRGIRTVSGWVLGTGGLPLPGASVTLAQAGVGKRPPRWKTRADARGAFLFEHLPSTRFSISAGTRGKLVIGEQVSTEVGHVWGLDLRLEQAPPNFAAVASAAPLPPPGTPKALAHTDCALATAKQRARLHPEVIASAAVIWDQLIGLRGMQFHVETAIALLHRATQETHGTALQGAARVALAEAWDPKQSDESRAASLKVEEARLFAEFDASQTDSVTPILDQFFGHVREVTDAVRRARTRLQAALDGLRLTEAQVACVTQRVWENTIARYHDGDSSPGAPRR